MGEENLFNDFDFENVEIIDYTLSDNYGFEQDDSPVDENKGEPPVSDDEESGKQDNKNNKKVNNKSESTLDNGLEIEKIEVSNQDLEEDTTEDEKNNPGDTGDLKTLTPYALSLKSSGILPNLDESVFNEASPEEHSDLLKQEMEKELNARIEGWMQSLNPEVSNLIKLALSGVPVKEAIEATEKVQEYNKLTEDSLADNDELMRKVLLEDKLSRGYSKEDALEEIEALADLDKPAKAALKRLKINAEQEIQRKQERIKEEEAQRKKANEEIVKKIQTTAETVSEVIPGVKIHKTVKDNVLAQMLTPVDTPEGKMSKIAQIRNENPIEFDFKLNYLLYITDGFKDFSKVKQAASTDALKELQKKIETNEHKSSTKITTERASKDASTVDMLNNFFGSGNFKR